MYRDDLGREWHGPIPCDLEMIATQAPVAFGVYQIMYPECATRHVAYIGIVTGDTIHGRRWKHATARGNWALARLGDPARFECVWYICDAQTAREIESHVHCRPLTTRIL